MAGKELTPTLKMNWFHSKCPNHVPRNRQPKKKSSQEANTKMPVNNGRHQQQHQAATTQTRYSYHSESPRQSEPIHKHTTKKSPSKTNHGSQLQKQARPCCNAQLDRSTAIQHSSSDNKIGSTPPLTKTRGDQNNPQSTTAALSGVTCWRTVAIKGS